MEAWSLRRVINNSFDSIYYQHVIRQCRYHMIVLWPRLYPGVVLPIEC